MECPTSIAGIAANAAASLSREITLISGCLETVQPGTMGKYFHDSVYSI